MVRTLSLFLLFNAINTNVFAAEAGMPQLDPTYWVSQAFWLILIFSILYISISRFYLPKIKNNLDDRENKIKEDLENANKFRQQSETKIKEYELIIENAKKEINKIHFDSKNLLDKDIQSKKDAMEKEIEKEVAKAQIDIIELKKNSITTIQNISKNIASNIIENISGDKLNENLITRFDNIIIVGGMANNIIEYNGFNIGKSIKEINCEKIIKEIFSLAKNYNCNVVYPKDVSVGRGEKDTAKIKKLTEILDDDLILDIGPETVRIIKSIIDNSKTILWNGPAGYFENENFAKGSTEIAKKIVSMKENIYSVAGGGDTIALLNKIKLFHYFNFVSTAGGAFLEYLEGKEIPGIKALNKNV